MDVNETLNVDGRTYLAGLTTVATGLVPFGNHNQGARLLQGSKNQKQGIGFYAANFPVRMDMDTNLLHYPQIPIVSTILHDLSEYEKHPSGQSVLCPLSKFLEMICSNRHQKLQICFLYSIV